MRASIRHLMAAALAALSLVAAPGAFAQGAYPNKPIRLVIPIGAGGVGDNMMRVISERMLPTLGQPLLLDNRPGAGGNIGMDLVAHAPPDGYTLLMNGPAMAINASLYKKLSFDPAKDLIPITPIALAQFAVFVSGKLPVKNIGEFIAYAKSSREKLNFASVGAGTAGHLSAVLFTLAAGIEMTHVPYKSIQAAVPDLVTGSVHLVFNAYPPLAPLLADGKLKVMGFTSLKRQRGYPDVPTLSETGLPGFEAGGWYMVAAPAGTPHDVLQRLNTEMVRAVNSPEASDALIKMGLEPLALSLNDSARFFAREIDTWGRAVKVSGASAD